MEGGVSGGGDGVDVLRDRRVGLQCAGGRGGKREKERATEEEKRKEKKKASQSHNKCICECATLHSRKPFVHPPSSVHAWTRA